VIYVRQKLDTSERRTCKTIGIGRSTQRYRPAVKSGDEELRLAMIRLAKQYGRYGYRKIAKLLRIEGRVVNHKKIERLWREEGLQLPHRHKKQKRLYHKDGSVIRLRGAVRRMRTGLSMAMISQFYAAQSCCHSTRTASR